MDWRKQRQTSTKFEDVIPDVGQRFELDISVQKVLPPESRVLSSTTYKVSPWTRAARVKVLLEDSSEKSYFLKCAAGELGKSMLHGEHASINEIAKYRPDVTVVPIARGRFEGAPVPIYYFLMEFLDMDPGPRSPDRLCVEVAKLHASSVSPTGQFGFHTTTYQGPFRQDNTWDNSWARYFGRLLRLFLSYEIDANGHSADGRYEAEFQTLLNVTVDRLLRPLQSDGRQLKPCLVHGDLWHDNVATEQGTGQPKIFDAACFYAHNEFELGMWRRPAIAQGFRKLYSHEISYYFAKYRSYFPASEPADQWDDRNRLYCVNFELCQSTVWEGSAEASRKTILEHMIYLNQKYATNVAADLKRPE